MKTNIRILFASTLILGLSSCGKDQKHVDLQAELRSGETVVTELLQQTIAGGAESVSMSFSDDFTKEAYVQTFRNLEAEVGKFNQLDLVSAKWNPAEFSEHENEEDPIMTRDNIRVMAVLLSGQQSGATLNFYLEPAGSSWTLTGLDAETTGGKAEETISQAD
jgi:hypothetical protein